MHSKLNIVKTKYIEYLNSTQGARKYNQFKKILYSKPDSLVLKLFNEVYPSVQNKKIIKVLDVGGGDGKY